MQVPIETEDADATLPRGSICVYCGYDLTGSTDTLACPECGRISTVDAVRGETHALFDQPVRLYREALRFWSKHPPGWFWSLDRDGDVRRSRILLAINVMLVFAIVTGGWLVACSCVVTVTGTERHLDPAGIEPPLLTRETTRRYGALGTTLLNHNYFPEHDRDLTVLTYDYAEKHEVAWALPQDGKGLWGLGIATWLVVNWFLVGQLGFLTQNLFPCHATQRPDRTVAAAVNAESCRLPAQAMVLALLLAVDAAVRVLLPAGHFREHRMIVAILIPLGIALVWSHWICPLRSDSLGMLVPTRRRAVWVFGVYLVCFGSTIGTLLGVLASEFAIHALR
jgi:hypothetical protein